MLQNGSLGRGNFLDVARVVLEQLAEPELSNVVSVRGQLGECVRVQTPHEDEVERGVPRADQHLGDPRNGHPVRGSRRQAGPQGRVLERDSTPVPADVRDRVPAALPVFVGPGRVLERAEVEDEGEQLDREDGDRGERVAERT
jgi:hypothetical protein